MKTELEKHFWGTFIHSLFNEPLFHIFKNINF